MIAAFRLGANAQTGAAVAPTVGGAALPRSFHEISLGMDIESLKSALKADGLFDFRGDADVSFLPMRKQNVIDTAGLGFIKRAFFQLDSGGTDDVPPSADAASSGGETGGVFIMMFVLNPEKIDHYSVFTRFMEKYGEPVVLNPKLALWEDGATRVYIERPLTVKYIDKAVFDRLVEEGKALESVKSRLREEFLDDF